MDFFKQLFEDDPQPPIWQLRDIRFDIESTLEFHAYEKVLAVIPNIEDQKGNPRQSGTLVITNFRIIWHLNGSRDINFTVGFDTISRIEKKVIFLKENNAKYTMIVRAGRNNAKYEFNFASFFDSLNIFGALIIKYHELIMATNSSRRLLVKSTFLKDGRVDFLPNQKHVSNYNAKYMYNKGIGVDGILYISNIRIVFQSNGGKAQNFSLPWICILQIKINEQNDGSHIVFKIKLNQGFYINCSESKKLFNQVSKLHQTYNQRPILGIEQAQKIFQMQQKAQTKYQQDIQIVQSKVNILKPAKSSKNYQVGSLQQRGNQISKISFSQQLGLAIQQLPQGQTINSLWKLLK